MKGFGRPTGTLVDWVDSGHRGQNVGGAFYISALNADVYDAYDRDLWLEMLNDWGWQLDPSTAPAWYSGATERD